LSKASVSLSLHDSDQKFKLSVNLGLDSRSQFTGSMELLDEERGTKHVGVFKLKQDRRYSSLRYSQAASESLFIRLLKSFSTRSLTPSMTISKLATAYTGSDKIDQSGTNISSEQEPST